MTMRLAIRCLAVAGLLGAPPAGWAQSRPATAPASRPVAAPGGEAAKQSAAKEEEVEEVNVEPAGASLFWGPGYPQIDRGINLHLPRVTRKRALTLVIDHRTNQPVQVNTWHDYFGFDGGALKIGLGLRFGIWDNLDAGFYRLNGATERFDTYQFDAKYHLLHQVRHLIDLGLRFGVVWYSQEDAEDAVAYLGELLLSRLLFHRLTLATSLLFHSDSTNANKANTDDNWSLAVGFIVDVRILAWLAWNVELALNAAGYGTRDERTAAGEQLGSYPVFSSAVKFITTSHTFALVLSNNPYVSADGLVGNTSRGFNRLIVGFTITREWAF